MNFVGHIIAHAHVGIVLLLVGVLATGCVNADVASEFRADGGAQHSFSFTVPTTLYEDEAAEFESSLPDPAGIEARGFEMESIETADRTGYRVTSSVKNAEDVGAALNDLFTALNSESDGEPMDAFSGTFTRHQNLAKTTYTLNVTVDGNEFLNSSENPGDEVPPEMLREFVNLTYTAKLPGQLVDHNGTVLPDGRVQWELPVTSTATFTATSEERQDVLRYTLLGVSLLVVLLAIAVVIVWRRGAGTA